jgi:hypothetical protein
LKLLEGEVFLSERFIDTGGNLWARRLVWQLLDGELVKPEELQSAVSEGIVLYGLQLYDEVRDGRVMPDHVASPEALAYALCSGRIPLKEAQRIKFDHGETLDSFMRRAEDLLQRVMTALQREPTHLAVSPSGFGHVAEPHN